MDTLEDLQGRVDYLENALQRKAEQVASDERAITKLDDEVNKAELQLSRAKSPSLAHSAQNKLKSKREERQRKMKARDGHKKEQNSLNKQLISARRSLSEYEAEMPEIIPFQPTDSMDKIYQIFVSSTYEDLKLERQEVMAAVVSTGNVPVGMEYFPAGNASPFDYIKQQIDSADYYILVVAGKYGSINKETGISYTEMEFDYAIEKKVPVAVLLSKDINKLVADKIELDNDRRSLLEAFRKKVSDGRMVSFWEDKKDLKAQVKDAITNLIKNSPRTGWVRADQVTMIKQEDIDSNILNRVIPVSYDNSLSEFFASVENEGKVKELRISDILAVLVPYLRNPSHESLIDEQLKGKYGYLSNDTIERVKIELLKHKLVETNNLIIQDNGAYMVWTVTKKGLDLWLESLDEA